MECHVKPEQAFNLIFSYNDRYLECKLTLEAVAGDNILLGSVVPTGEIWVVTAMGARNVQTNPTVTFLGVYDGTTYYFLKSMSSPGANRVVINDNPYIMKTGDRVFVFFSGCVLHDDLIVDINGYKMKLAR